MRLHMTRAMAVAAVAIVWPQVATAQTSDFDQLMAMDLRSLEGEIQQRYDAGLARSLDEAIVAANDSRYYWALETKVQCGIALGYLESSTRDETSIRNCNRAYGLMNYVPAPAPVRVAPPPPPPQSPAICSDEVAGIVFFDFDEAVLTPDAAQTLQTVLANIPICGWTSFSVVGHTDQAGSDAYNVALSQDRADAVAAAMAARGVAPGAISVAAAGESRPRVVLPDGTRSPQNRRVEISAE